jgi:hypothetical protein
MYDSRNAILYHEDSADSCVPHTCLVTTSVSCVNEAIKVNYPRYETSFLDSDNQVCATEYIKVSSRLGSPYFMDLKGKFSRSNELATVLCLMPCHSIVHVNNFKNIFQYVCSPSQHERPK